MPRPLQGGDQPGPAQGDVQDGHLDHQLLPRRLQFRGGRPVALAVPRILPRPDHAASPASASPASRRRCGSCTRAPIAEAEPPLAIGGFYRYRRGGETHTLEAKVDPPAPARGGDRQLPRLQAASPRCRQAQDADLAPRSARLQLASCRRCRSTRSRASPRSGSASSRRACRWARSSPEAHETLTIAMNRIGAQLRQRRGRRGPGAVQAATRTATTPTRRSSRWPRAASASPPNI